MVCLWRCWRHHSWMYLKKDWMWHHGLVEVLRLGLDSNDLGGLIQPSYSVILWRVSSIWYFLCWILFWVMFARVNCPRQDTFLGKTQNEIFWQKPFGAKFRGKKHPPISKCVVGRQVQLFHAVLEIWKCIKLGLY